MLVPFDESFWCHQLWCPLLSLQLLTLLIFWQKLKLFPLSPLFTQFSLPQFLQLSHPLCPYFDSCRWPYAPISIVFVTPISVVEIITTVEMIHSVQIIFTVPRIPAIVVAPIPTLSSSLFPRLSLSLFPFPLLLFARYWFLFGRWSGLITQIGGRIDIWFGGSRSSKYGFWYQPRLG